MKVLGSESVESMHESESYVFKLVANDSAAFFFPHTTEHRDAKLPGLSYEDDSAGNALAAMVRPGRIEFRFHRAFADDHVRAIAQQILSHPQAAFAAAFEVVYQGRLLIRGS